jgi:hypothetical protein
LAIAVGSRESALSYSSLSARLVASQLLSHSPDGRLTAAAMPSPAFADEL